jgi:phosphonate transport system substrate-binding protein
VRTLRLLSYLAPSIPGGFFIAVAERLGAELGVPVDVDFDTSVSGPSPANDPFPAGRADLAFVCGPSYPLLRAAGSPVALLPAAPVFAEPRAEGRPVYFSDVVVRRDHPARAFEELRGARWAYNDRFSRSGWGNMVARLAAMDPAEAPTGFFRSLVHSGSHVASLDLVARGEADAAAIDSNTLWLAARHRPADAALLRVVEAWGPMPIQPLLGRAALDSATRDRIVRSLLTWHEDPGWTERVGAYGVARFTLVQESDYAEVRPVEVARPAAVSPEI